jgi:hypothetical protein
MLFGSAWKWGITVTGATTGNHSDWTNLHFLMIHGYFFFGEYSKGDITSNGIVLGIFNGISNNSLICFAWVSAKMEDLFTL